MNVDYDRNVQKTLGATLTAELEQVFGAFESATGLTLCFRPTSDRWRDVDGIRVAPEPYMDHRSSFCRGVKAKAFSACTKCDVADLPADCSQADLRRPQPFVRACHAGAQEILVPLWRDRILVAVVFIGQFVDAARRESAPTELRRLTEQEIAQCLRLMAPIRSYLDDVLRRLEEQQQQPGAGRRAFIEAYVRENLSSGPPLRGLAAELSLSPSRASHVVREVTGGSFQQLVEAQRLRVAKDLLTSTNSKIAWIAFQTGLKSGPYFSRYFRQKVGMTPSAYRGDHRRSLDV